MNVLIFSRDRACQLHALLETFKRFAWTAFASEPIVLWRATSYEFGEGYRLAQQRFPWVRWRQERSFRDDVLCNISPRDPLMMFLVDDQVFRREPCLQALRTLMAHDEVLCASLRLSPKINRCYTRDIPAPPPQFSRSLGWLLWDWEGCAGDWGYPVSQDGNIFRTSEVLPLIKGIPWNSPNQMESRMSACPPRRPRMACREEHCVINIVANRVQTDYANRVGDGGSPEFLNQQYLAGKVIDVQPLIGIENCSPHVEAVYQLKPCD